MLKDDRLAAGQEGELAVFWAAISWLEAEQSRRRNADEASFEFLPLERPSLDGFTAVLR